MIEPQTKCNTKFFSFFKMVNMMARMVNMDKLDKVLWISKSTIVWCAAVSVTRNDIAKTILANQVKTTRERKPNSDFFAIISIYQNIFITEKKFHDWKNFHLPKYFLQGDYWDLMPDGLLSISLWQVVHPKTSESRIVVAIRRTQSFPILISWTKVEKVIYKDEKIIYKW